MKTAEVFDLQGAQVVRLPDEFRFHGGAVSIRKAGEAVILEPVKPEAWPASFFVDIQIDDPNFTRPGQGQFPPAPNLE